MSPGKAAHNMLADRVLSALWQKLRVAAEAPDWSVFHRFRERVRATFTVPETSITPLMARILWGISAGVRPRDILVLGSYAGLTLVWLAGPVLGKARRILGVEMDPEAVALARSNFARLGAHGVDFCCGDALDVVPRLTGTFDLVLIDVDDPIHRKGLYKEMLQGVEPLLAPGALILAHDICVERFRQDLAPYLEMVRNPNRFRRSVPLEIDPCGLEVTLR